MVVDGHGQPDADFVGVMVVFFGGLTAWFNDATFFKMKTTFVYGTFAVILGAGLARGKSLLQWVMAEALPMKPEGWMILTRRLALMFAVLAMANEVIWRTQSEKTWVILETFAMPAATSWIPDGELHGAATLPDRGTEDEA